jgi:hypothetical protein
MRGAVAAADVQEVLMAKATGRSGAKARRRIILGLAERMGSARSLREGAVVLHYADGTTTHLQSAGGAVRVAEGAPAQGEVLLEVFGDADTISGILAGERDAVREFFAGGLRVRGDIGYLSDLGVELGILRRPL